MLDTCGTSGSVALAEGGARVASEALPGRSASERLVPVVRGLLEGRGWRLADLAAIVVVHGPGSFTGVRIGLSAAKGLSDASGVPLVAISRLAVLGGKVTLPPFAEGAKDGAPGVCAALDAGRGEFYLRDATGGESLATLAELRAVVREGEIVVCEQRVLEALQGGPQATLVMEPTAADALAIAVGRIAASQFDDAATVDANYLRRSEGLYGRTVQG